MSAMLRIDEPAPGVAPRGVALWQLGFRPFYLLASGFGAFSIALWAVEFAGLAPVHLLASPLWHAHEMVFGFTLAVIVGFLFTAGSNWTHRATLRRRRLAGLAALWVAGRVLVLTHWGVAAMVANVAFPLVAAIALAIPFVQARSRRNYFFPVLLAAMALACLAVHLSALGIVGWSPWAGIGFALDVVLFILCVMGGRVIPMFTNNGVPGAGAVRHEGLDRAALASVLALVACDGLAAPAWVAAPIAAVAALLHLARWGLWRPWRTLRVPLVAVLHAGYAWIPLHLALRAAAEAGLVAPSLATHALTAGAIGSLVIGMMTRTAKGHTARPLRATRLDTASYVLVVLAALARVAGPAFAPALTIRWVLVAAALWSAGFALYAFGYARALVRPRLDGRPG